VSDVKFAITALCGFTLAAGAIEPALSKTSYVPFVIRQVSGKRPFVQAKLNGVPLLLMVHSNADFFVMTTHANAARAGLKKLKSVGHYGIVAHGKVSALGRAETTLGSLRVGVVENKDVALSVFETPQKPVMQGMLGVQWLRANHVIVDYAQRRLGFAETDADAAQLGEELRGRGYIALRMTWHPERRNYTVEGTVAGAADPVLVSTVSENIIGLPIARRLNLPLVDRGETAGGPAGSVQPSFTSSRAVPLCMEGHRWPVGGAVIYDQAIYAGKPGTPANVPASITLGADFMLQNSAVIDYTSGTLYVRPSAAGGTC